MMLDQPDQGFWDHAARSCNLLIGNVQALAQRQPASPAAAYGCFTAELCPGVNTEPEHNNTALGAFVKSELHVNVKSATCYLEQQSSNRAADDMQALIGLGKKRATSRHSAQSHSHRFGAMHLVVHRSFRCRNRNCLHFGSDNMIADRVRLMAQQNHQSLQEEKHHNPCIHISATSCHLLKPICTACGNACTYTRLHVEQKLTMLRTPHLRTTNGK